MQSERGASPLDDSRVLTHLYDTSTVHNISLAEIGFARNNNVSDKLCWT